MLQGVRFRVESDDSQVCSLRFDLFHDTAEDKIEIAKALYDEGIIAIKQSEGSEE